MIIGSCDELSWESGEVLAKGSDFVVSQRNKNLQFDYFMFSIVIFKCVH